MGQWHRSEASGILTSRGYSLLNQVYKGVEWNFTEKLAKNALGTLRGGNLQDVEGWTEKYFKATKEHPWCWFIKEVAKSLSWLISRFQGQAMRVKIRKSERLKNIWEGSECRQSSLYLIGVYWGSVADSGTQSWMKDSKEVMYSLEWTHQEKAKRLPLWPRLYVIRAWEGKWRGGWKRHQEIKL